MNIPNNNEQELMDNIFRLLFEKKSEQTVINQLSLKGKDLNHYLNQIIKYNKLFDLNLVKYKVSSYGTVNIFEFNLPLAHQHISSGGFKRHFQEMRSEQKFLENKKNIEFEKLDLEVKYIKFLIKTKFLPHILSALALVISIIALFVK